MPSTRCNLTVGAVTLPEAFENVTGEVLLPEAHFNWHWEESAYLNASLGKKLKKRRNKMLVMPASTEAFYRH